MQFDLVSPENKLASMDVTAVELPGSEGDFTAMPEHSPVLTTLRPGVVRARWSGGEESYVVSGGFVEVNGESVSILAEWAVPSIDAKAEDIEKLVAEAEAATRGSAGAAFDAAALRLHHIKHLLTVISG
ncbi:MAG: ATP synthase F1 subunit epsilon [Rhodobacteraceae bacterium]|nr:ATP synthase F1 subunit epsilon [Paracoccaceae bacterium]